jgi:hypothetical protein
MASIFLCELGGKRVEILLVGLVIFVDADAGRRGGRQKDMMIGHAGRRRGALEVGDIPFDEGLAAIFDRADAHHRRQADDGAAHHRLLEILGVILGKCRYLLSKQLELLVGPPLKAFQALVDVSEESGLGEFTVSDDVDAAFRLLAHHIVDRFRQQDLEFSLVERLPGELRLHQVEQIMRARQAADMGCLDAVGVLLDVHGNLLG